MKFCCSNFELFCMADKRTMFNIRIVKYHEKIDNCKLFFKPETITPQMKTTSPYNFFVTGGYIGSFDTSAMPTLNISFCPFCGVNLFDYYSEEEWNDYVHEIQAENLKFYPTK